MTLCAGSVQIYGDGSRERRHGAALEPLAQRGDALGGAYELAILEVPTDVIASEAANDGQKCSAGSDTCGHEASLLHSFDRLILGQVERQQLYISYIEALIAEVDVLLL